MTDSYLGAPSSESNAEAVRTIESEDFSRFTTMAPGNYTNPSRSIELEDGEAGHFTACLTFDGGFVSEEGRTYPAGKYPIKKWIYSTPFKAKSRDGQELPGTTSGVAEYLRAVGVNPKGMDLEAAKVAILETALTPVGVYVGRTDRAIKNEATGKFESQGLKTRDFNVGTKDAPVWAEQVERDGRVFRAKPTVTSFSRVA